MIPLPPPVRRYFEANARLDPEALLAAFADDAVVRDEAQSHGGASAIRAWIEQATIGSQAIAVAKAIRTDDSVHHVTATVAGAFPGSPIGLTFHFRLVGDHIAELEID